jgi:hypothetical protein
MSINKLFKSPKKQTSRKENNFSISTSILSSNTYYVDSVYGNDTSGVPNNVAKPFKTIGSAISSFVKTKKTQTVNIIIKPGTYLENQLLLANANFIFEDATIVENSSPLPLFSDTSTNAYIFNIKGKATFITSRNGPILSLCNQASIVDFECETIQAEDTCPITISNAESIILKITRTLCVNGLVKSLMISSRKCDGFVQTMLGTNSGLEIGCFDGGVEFRNIECINAVIYYKDYSCSTDRAVQFFKCNSLRAKRAYIDTINSDTYWDIRDAVYTEGLYLTSEPISSYPLARVSFGRLKVPQIYISWNIGSLTFQVSVSLDMGVSGNFTITGSQEGANATSIPSTIVNVCNFIGQYFYIGCCMESDIVIPKHSCGYLSVNVDSLNITQYYIMTMVSSNTLSIPLMPKIAISGNIWRGVGSITVQTYGSVNMEIKNIRGNIPNGGVLTIQDYGTQSSDNTGILQIMSSIIKNECSTMENGSSVLTAIYAPVNTNNIVQILYCTLSIGLASSNPALSDNSTTNIQPIYPIQNFITPPILNVVTYKNITSSLPGALPGAPTLWSGANQYDPLTTNV